MKTTALWMSAGVLLQCLSGCAAESDGAAGLEGAEQSALAQQAGGKEKFSFFVTSLRAMRELSKSQSGFGGDLRFGETGAGAGLKGADKLCAAIAEDSLPGSGSKVWRAFLSTTAGGANGGPVHAKDRVGEGPWYDRLGRLVALTRTDLIQIRPKADNAIINDLPNEDGVPNHNPDGTGQVDNHDILTGSNEKGELFANDVKYTCADWTKSAPDAKDSPRVGHSWPRNWGRPGGTTGTRPGFPGFPGRGTGELALQVPGPEAQVGNTEHWISALNEAGCGAGVSIVEMGAPRKSNPTVGSGGGYGGIYCFALTP